MSSFGTDHGRLLAACLLGLVLLVGRFALAAHPYQHDVDSREEAHCEICAFAICVPDPSLPESVSSPDAFSPEIDLAHAETTLVLVRPRSPKRPRAPPVASF